MIKFFKKIKKSVPKYHTSIDTISVFNWGECVKGNIEYTRKDLKKGTTEDDLKAWDSVFDSYIERYGISGSQMYLFDMQNELAITRCELAETGDRYLLNRINVMIADIEEVIDRNKNEGMDISSIMILVSKWIGYGMQEEDTTVKRLHDMLDLMKKEYNQNKKLTNGSKEK